MQNYHVIHYAFPLDKFLFYPYLKYMNAYVYTFVYDVIPYTTTPAS